MHCSKNYGVALVQSDLEWIFRSRERKEENPRNYYSFRARERKNTFYITLNLRQH
jgi:hypothetical protein